MVSPLTLTRRGGLLLATAVVSCLAQSTAATAAGFQLCEQSAKAAATACVGQALFANAFDNPAAMTLADQPTVESSARLVALDHEFHPAAAPIQGGGNGGDAGAPVLMPATHVVLPLDERLTVGASFTAPYGLGLKYDSGWAGRYYVEKIGLQTLNATFGVGYRALDWLSVGAGVSLQHAEARYRRKLNNVLDGLPDGTFALRLSDWATGFNAGVVADLSPDLQLGISYRSRLDHDLSGDAVLSGVGPTLVGFGVSGTRAHFPLDLPDHLIASLTWRPCAELGLTAEAAWSGWGDLNTATVTLDSGFVDATARNWDDTYRLGLSAEYAVTPATIVRAGFSFDSSPTDAAHRLPDLPADRQIAFAFGVEHEILDGIRATVGYTYADLGANRIDANLGPLTGPITGEMPEHIHYLGIGVSSAF